MASQTSYESLLQRATDADSEDPTQLYDIADKVKGDDDAGALSCANAAKQRLAFPDNAVKRRLLKTIDILIVEGGPKLHQALIQNGFFGSVAEIRDPEIESSLPKYLTDWKKAMGPECETALDQIFNRRPADSDITVRAPAGLGRFSIVPVNPLSPFLTMAYLRAQRVLDQARQTRIFHSQSIHIARQALHLVIKLNDSVSPEDGPTDEEDDERIDLEDDLLDLSKAMNDWGDDGKSDYLDYIPSIKEYYAKFFRRRPYFEQERNPESDRLYNKLLAHDKKNIRALEYKRKYNISQMGIIIEDDNDDNRSEAFIESVRTSPAVSESRLPGDQAESSAAPLSQVNVVLPPGTSAEAGSSSAAAGASSGPTEEGVASTSAAGGSGAAAPEDDLERARRFRQQQTADDAGDQTFACPVPGCGKSFDKQYLLKHHIREHDDRPYKCPMRDCDRRFATPTEQRVHEALHRIKNMGIIPNMPSFSAPIASTSAPPAATAPVEEEVPAEQAAAEAAKSDGARSPEPTIDPALYGDDNDMAQALKDSKDYEEKKEEGKPSGSGEPYDDKPEGSGEPKPSDYEEAKPAEAEEDSPKPDEPAAEPSSAPQPPPQT